MESNNKFCIGTSDGLLIPKTLQRPGGKMLKTEDFFRGFEFPFGCRLNSFPSHPLLKKVNFLNNLKDFLHQGKKSLAFRLKEFVWNFIM